MTTAINNHTVVVPRDIKQDLDRLLKLPEGLSSATLPEMELKNGMAALAALIAFLELLANEDNFKQMVLTKLDFGQVCCNFLKTNKQAKLSLSHTHTHKQFIIPLSYHPFI